MHPPIHSHYAKKWRLLEEAIHFWHYLSYCIVITSKVCKDFPRESAKTFAPWWLLWWWIDLWRMGRLACLLKKLRCWWNNKNKNLYCTWKWCMSCCRNLRSTQYLSLWRKNMPDSKCITCANQPDLCDNQTNTECVDVTSSDGQITVINLVTITLNNILAYSRHNVKKLSRVQIMDIFVAKYEIQFI